MSRRLPLLDRQKNPRPIESRLSSEELQDSDYYFEISSEGDGPLRYQSLLNLIKK